MYCDLHTRIILNNVLKITLENATYTNHLSHRLKWGVFLPNEVGRITQHIRKGEGRNEGENRGIVLGISLFFHPSIPN